MPEIEGWELESRNEGFESKEVEKGPAKLR